jgi:hypothetical protein
MKDGYSEFLTAIIDGERKISPAKKEILHLLLAHRMIDKGELSSQEVHETVDTVVSVIYGHMHSLRDQNLIHTCKRNGILHFSINIDAIEDLGRQQRARADLKAEIIRDRVAQKTHIEK